MVGMRPEDHEGTNILDCPLNTVRIKMTGDSESKDKLANPGLPEKWSINWTFVCFHCLIQG